MVPPYKFLRLFIKVNLSPAAPIDYQLCAPTLFHRRLRNSVPRPGQRWKPGSPWRLPFSNWWRQSAGRASGKPNRPSLLHAELLLHLLTLINSHPFPPLTPPFTSELQLTESVHQHTCGTTNKPKMHILAFSKGPNHSESSLITVPVWSHFASCCSSRYLNKNLMLETDTVHVDVKQKASIFHVVLM